MALKRIVGICIILGISVSGAAVVQRRYAEDLRHQLGQRLNELHQELDAISHRRPPAGSSEEAGKEGFAWDEYQRALDLLAERSSHALTALSIKAVEAASLNPQERFETATQLSANLEEEIRCLREGASRLDATPKDRVEADGTSHLPKLITAKIITNALALQGIAAVEARNPRGGANMILDAMQLGQDFTRSRFLLTQIIGSSVLLPDALKVYLENNPLEGLGPEALERLDEGIIKLIQAAPRTPELRGEFGLFQERLDTIGIKIAASTARQTLSMLDWVDHERAENALETVHNLQQRSEQAVLGGLQRQYFSGCLSSVIQVRHCTVQLHMLHAAIREVRGLQPEPFQEPFGMPLQTEEEGNPRVLVVHAPEGISAAPVRLRLASPR